MGDKNPIRTLRDYSKPCHEGYMNTIELLVGNNVVPLRSDTIRTYSKKTLIMASIVGRAAVIGKHQKFPHHVSFYLKYEIDRAAAGKLRDKNADESWEIIEYLPCYDHEGWNDSKEFVKPVKAISTPQSTLKTPDRRLLELEDQINFLIKGRHQHRDLAQRTSIKLMLKWNSRRCISGCFWLCVPRGLRDKEDEKRPFILGTPILTTAKAVIKYDKGTITLSSRKSKISFHREANTIRTLGDYSKPRHEGYKNAIELLVGNNVVPLRSDTIQLYEIDLYDESWEIIENLAFYDHEGWNDSKEFVKPVKAISTPQSTSKTPDQRLVELKDQINFLLKRSRPTPRPNSTHIPQAYAEAVYSNHRLQNQNGPPKQNPFSFHNRTDPNPQPQGLLSRLEYRTTWHHTLKGWKDLRMPFSKARGDQR
nr:hypothetical protein [Tanacetum cinerariifolium]